MRLKTRVILLAFIILSGILIITLQAAIFIHNLPMSNPAKTGYSLQSLISKHSTVLILELIILGLVFSAVLFFSYRRFSRSYTALLNGLKALIDGHMDYHPPVKSNGDLYEASEAYFKIRNILIKNSEMLAQDRESSQKSQILLEETSQRYRLISENMTDIIIMTDVSFNETFVSPSFERFIQSLHPQTDRQKIHWDQILTPESMKNLNKSISNLLALNKLGYSNLSDYQSIELEFILNNGISHWYDFQLNPILSDSSKINGFLAVGRDIHNKKQIEGILRDSEEKYRSLYSSMSEGMALHQIISDQTGLPVDARYLDINSSYELITGLNRNEIIGRSILQVFPQLDQNLIQDFGKTASTGKPSHLETFYKPRNQYYDMFIYSPKPGQFATLVSDITERKKSEQKIQNSIIEKDTLLKEVHHRVKNNLQIVSSLLHLQEHLITDQKSLEIFQASQNRIKSMAMIHERLYQSRDLSRIDFKPYSMSLLYNLFHSYGVELSRIHLDLQMEEISLPVDRAITCGLILNELASNSLKHAFPKGRRGTIKAALTSRGDQYQMTVSDDGIGFPEAFEPENTKTLGMQLVYSLVKQLNGSINIQNTDHPKNKKRRLAEIVIQFSIEGHSGSDLSTGDAHAE